MNLFLSNYLIQQYKLFMMLQGQCSVSIALLSFTIFSLLSLSLSISLSFSPSLSHFLSLSRSLPASLPLSLPLSLALTFAASRGKACVSRRPRRSVSEKKRQAAMERLHHYCWVCLRIARSFIMKLQAACPNYVGLGVARIVVVWTALL